MNEKRRILYLLIIMASVALAVAVVSIGLLYKAGLDEEQLRMVEHAQSQARIIEAIAKHESFENITQEEILEKTMSQIRMAQENYQGHGKTGEFTIAQKVGDNIVFLLCHRHVDNEIPDPVPFNSDLAEPQRLALSGESGTVVGLDYRGETVMAAYEPVAGLGLGIVTKIDLAEVRAPFYRAMSFSGLALVFFVTLGSIVFLRISNPLIKQLENSLDAVQESEEKYRSLFEHANDSIFIIDLSTRRFLDVNKNAVKGLGYTKEEFLKMPVSTIVSPQATEGVEENYQKLKKTGRIRFEHIHRRKDGTDMQVEISSRMIEYGGKQITQSIVRDITRRKREIELLQALNNAAAFIQKSAQSQEGIFRTVQEELQTVGFRGGISFINEDGDKLVFQRIISTSPFRKLLSNLESLTGLQSEGFAVNIKQVDAYRQVIETGKALYVPNSNVVVKQLLPKSMQKFLGSIFEILDSYPGIYTPLIWEGEVRGILNVAGNQVTQRDLPAMEAFANHVSFALHNASLFEQAKKEISDRKAVEEEIRKLNLELENRVRERTAQLEEANQELEAFSYSVSHDLRAPLRAINGFAGLLEEQYMVQLDEVGKTYINNVQVSSRKMGFLIDDLLALSRLGRKDLVKSKVKLCAGAEDVFAELIKREPSRAIDFSINKEECREVEADNDMVEILFTNLISNAIKFTREKDPAIIEVGCIENEGEYVCYVQDNGIGFEMKYADKLFTPFQRLHREEEYEGTGIGLAIVHRIVQRHGGRVWVESEPDKGTTFYFTLSGIPKLEWKSREKTKLT